jgi:aa3 type cytochrome c oxidase subunit IV
MAVENDHDLQPHLDTWHGFVKVLFYSAGAAVLILALLAIFLL